MKEVEPFQLVKFKSSVLAQQCEKIGEQILNYQKYIDPIGAIVSNRGGWHSKFDMDNGKANFPFFGEWAEYLFKLLCECYGDYIEKFYEKQYREFWSDKQPWIIVAWFNINWLGDYNKEHSHLGKGPQNADEYYYVPPEMKNDREFWLPMAIGNFYVTDSHNTFFVSKVPRGPTKEEERKYIDFNAGDFLIAHPNLNHGVGINKQESPRISIAFNIIPKIETDERRIIKNL